MKRIIKLMLLVVCILSFGFSYAEIVFAPTLNVDTSVNGKIIVTVSADMDNEVILATKKPSLSIPCEFIKAHVEYDGKKINSSLADGEITFVVEKSGQYVIVKEQTTTNKPSSGGGGGGSSKPSTTTKNEDGSVTKTVTDKKTGTITETTQNKDGSTVIVEKTRDGKITTITTDVSGNKAEVIEVPSGEITVSVSIEKDVKTIHLPVSKVKNNDKVDLTISKPVTVTIPVENMQNDTVAVIVYEDGTEKVIRKSIVDGENMIVPMTESAIIKFVDNSKEFTDTAEHWGESAIDFVTSHELFNGTSENTFDPNMSMNRAMVAQVLHNLETNPDTEYNSTFKDIDEGIWYQEAVSWAVNKGIVSGYDNGMYGAKDNVTREQLITILYNYAKVNNLDINVGESQKLHNFKDTEKVSDYANSAFNWAIEKGIIIGSDGYLNPKGAATRAEVATMMQKFCMNIR